MNEDFTNFRTDKRIKRLREVIEKRQPTLSIVLENINDPHNLSAVVRSCDAVGIMEVCLVYYGEQPFPELGKSSSASAKKWVGIRKFGSVKECYTALRKENKKIYTTQMSSEAKSLYELNLTEPVALVFGNEHDGVSAEACKLADGNFLVPQVGMIQSLNISVACAVSLYEAFRQRLAAGFYDKPQLAEKEIDVYLKKWAKM